MYVLRGGNGLGRPCWVGDGSKATWRPCARLCGNAESNVVGSAHRLFSLYKGRRNHVIRKHRRTDRWLIQSSSSSFAADAGNTKDTEKASKGSSGDMNRSSSTRKDIQQGNRDSNNGLKLAWEVILPDTPLLLLTAFTLVGSIVATLCFPLALGDLFDVVREHIASLPYNNLVESSTGGISQTIADVRHAAATAPPAFRQVLLRLCLCLVASAIGNGAVAFLAPSLGERFGSRLRQRLMGDVLAKDQAFFDGISKGDLVSRITQDIGVLQATISDFLAQRGIRSILEVGISLGVM